MKRITIIIFLVAALAFVTFKYVQLEAVNANQAKNPNFVSHDEMNNVVQTNIDLIWTEMESMKNETQQLKNRVTQLENRISALE